MTWVPCNYYGEHLFSQCEIATFEDKLPSFTSLNIDTKLWLTDVNNSKTRIVSFYTNGAITSCTENQKFKHKLNVDGKEKIMACFSTDNFDIVISETGLLILLKNNTLNILGMITLPDEMREYIEIANIKLDYEQKTKNIFITFQTVFLNCILKITYI